MDKNNNKNVIKFSNRVNQKSRSDIKNYMGFEYSKMDSDVNGAPFIKETLVDYATGCKYLVRLMLEENNRPYLYTYYVHQDELLKFLQENKNGNIDGVLIEIEKYIPEDLA